MVMSQHDPFHPSFGFPCTILHSKVSKCTSMHELSLREPTKHKVKVKTTKKNKSSDAIIKKMQVKTKKK